MKWSYILTAYSLLFFFSTIDNARGPVWPSILEMFSLSQNSGSMFFVITSMSMVICTLLGRYWLNFLGLLSATRLSLYSMIVASLLTGVAGLYQSFSLLIIASIFTGVASGTSSLCMNLLIVRGTTVANYRRSISGLHAVYGIASLLAPLYILWAKHLNYFWYIPFFIFPIFALAGFLNLHKIKSTEGELSEIQKVHVKKREKLLLGALVGTYVAAEIAISSRLVFFTSERGYSFDTAALGLSIFFFLILIGRILFSLLSIKGKSLIWLSISLIGGIITALLGIHLHPYWLSLTGLFMSIFFPCVMDYVFQIYPEKTGEYLTTSILASIGLYLVICHLSLGFIAEMMGIQMAFYFIPLMLIISFVALHQLDRLAFKKQRAM